MERPARGRHLALVTRALREQLDALESGLLAETAPLNAAEAADRLALHLARVLECGIASLPDSVRVAGGVALTAELVARIARDTLAALDGQQPDAAGEVLSGVLGRQPDGGVESLPSPLVPLVDTALMTNAPGEPRVQQQILTEIPSADAIDVVMAFIRTSGILPLLGALRRHCEAGRPLRVLTTLYTGSTETRALEALARIGAQIRVSYDEESTRLHAKAWHFHRHTGFSTAYVGSSNLTHSAQVTGREWNVRFSAARNAHVLDKMAAVFESYWHSGDFEPFDASRYEAALAQSRRTRTPAIALPAVEIRLEPFQERLLEQVALARVMGRHRNLLVSATGTGKTVMAAVDYARLRSCLPRARLLFVAHRREILHQSAATFRLALRDASFGEMWVDGQRPDRFDHVFASIQSLARAGVAHLPADQFDVVIVDEFHHAEAESYRTLLLHLQPRELLGLTATPERSDGRPVLDWFDGRIAAELRLWDAIDQHRLVPFSYYGIADRLDYRQVPWRRGRGYAVDEVTNLITADDVWARTVVQAVTERVDEPGRMRALGFCVSVGHARHMARVFDAAGIRAVAIWSDTPAAERERALSDLAHRRVNAVFSVDLFNEGVDVPQVDTLLMLRPTDSPTLFLQQLGRGLRRHPEKALCTVIDFVGLHRREFRYHECLRALLQGSRRHVAQQVAEGFPYLPAGCHMEFDPVARDRVLESIRASVPNTWPRKLAHLRQFHAEGLPLTLAGFLDATGLDPDDLYGDRRCWTDLLEDAGLAACREGPSEAPLRRALGRLLHVDDLVRLDGYARLLQHEHPPVPAQLPVEQRRLLRMLTAALCGHACPRRTPLSTAAALIWDHPAVRAEALELLALLRTRISHLGQPLSGRPGLPLTVHGRYSRVEIQAACGDGDEDAAHVPAWFEGVKWMKAVASDVFLITLDKTGKGFSPTTRYRDYAISRHLLHWESQSRTRASDPTGTRYRTHESRGTGILVFARLGLDDRAFHFLGTARYVSHRSEMPMQITWRLDHPLPGDLFTRFAAAVA